MGLVPHTRLGSYEIIALIGSGGMGEVYQARDLRLDRIVALKVITGGHAPGPDLLMRFEREARAISSLNHPNICVLHDVGRERPLPPTTPGTGEPVRSGAEDDPLDFLVMEHLEGITLADRLARGRAHSTPGRTPPMNVYEAVDLALQIAHALDGAHRKGIVHRDLKPGNIMLTKAVRVGLADRSTASSVHVKLMDFGLARLTGEKDGRGHETLSLAQLSMPPTMTSPLTREGTILGTLHYMSPEQLEAKDVDARTDIFAFGVVLYETLSGRRPFEGKSQASIIGAILEQDPPPIASLQPETPALLGELVARCLAKDPDARWQSVRDLMRQLELISARADAPVSATTGSQPAPRTRLRVLPMITALLATALVAGGAVAWMIWPTPPPPPIVSRFTFVLPEGQLFRSTGHPVLALSPDGTRMVYAANQELYLRNMHELTAAPIPGTEGSNPTEPVFSPDGQWVAFSSRGAFVKVPVTGGAPVELSPIGYTVGATWEDGRILVGLQTPPGIVAIPEDGGAAKPLVTLSADSDESAASPQLLAGGRAVLFTLRSGAGAWDNASIVVQDLATGLRTVLLTGSMARVLPTGHLVYARAGTIFAVPFDAARLTVTGSPVPIQSGIPSAIYTGRSQLAWSASGTLAFVQGEFIRFLSSLSWFSEEGKELRTKFESRNYGVGFSELRVSPRGTHVAATVFSDGVLNLGGGPFSEIWVGDFERGTLARLSTSGMATSPVWTPDGARVCYDNGNDVMCQPSDGSSAAQTLFKLDGLINARPFIDQKRMVLETHGPKTGDDISIATIGPPFEMQPLLY
jgi:serine/threonine-protein kinase